MLPILASGRIGGLEIDLGYSGTRVYPITAGVVDEFHSYCTNSFSVVLIDRFQSRNGGVFASRTESNGRNR